MSVTTKIKIMTIQPKKTRNDQGFKKNKRRLLQQVGVVSGLHPVHPQGPIYPLHPLYPSPKILGTEIRGKIFHCHLEDPL